ncbi:MAG: M23 family metallopeptidase [Rikenellaceae bacterium]|nr:M23 family metallopeptidase [Rikenellaceae bacterium]MCL2691859.1 M23 family metallopeptidase [Rikenellaceae bacterium]
MAKKEYKLNPKTLTYEVVKTPFRLRFYRVMRKVLIGFILASVVNFLFSWFFITPKMYLIDRSNREALMEYEVLQAKIDASMQKIAEIRHRDQSVYRPLFGHDTICIPGIYNDYPVTKYAALEGDRYTPLMMRTWRQVDALARLVYLQSVSMDELQTLSFDKEKMVLSVPAIWPIDKSRWSGKMDRFGRRIHPIGRYWHHHTGLDLGAPRGTDVYVTANGTVVESRYNGAYGLQILVDHGFGYRTRYAHLSKSHVRPGQTVRRGETIGEVGSTGRSTGPHIHYEVIYMGTYVDPLNYFRLEMSIEELNEIIENAKEENFEEL